MAKYIHEITISDIGTGNYNISCSFRFINDVSTPYTTEYQISGALKNLSSKVVDQFAKSGQSKIPYLFAQGGYKDYLSANFAVLTVTLPSSPDRYFTYQYWNASSSYVSSKYTNFAQDSYAKVTDVVTQFE